MATIYKFEVKCVSAFCAFEQELIEKIVKDALEKWRDETTGLKLESIEVKKPNK